MTTTSLIVSSALCRGMSAAFCQYVKAANLIDLKILPILLCAEGLIMTKCPGYLKPLHIIDRFYMCITNC